MQTIWLLLTWVTKWLAGWILFNKAIRSWVWFPRARQQVAANVGWEIKSPGTGRSYPVLVTPWRAGWLWNLWELTRREGGASREPGDYSLLHKIQRAKHSATHVLLLTWVAEIVLKKNLSLFLSSCLCMRISNWKNSLISVIDHSTGHGMPTNWISFEAPFTVLPLI